MGIRGEAPWFSHWLNHRIMAMVVVPTCGKLWGPGTSQSPGVQGFCTTGQVGGESWAGEAGVHPRGHWYLIRFRVFGTVVVWVSAEMSPVWSIYRSFWILPLILFVHLIKQQWCLVHFQFPHLWSGNNLFLKCRVTVEPCFPSLARQGSALVS